MPPRKPPNVDSENRSAADFMPEKRTLKNMKEAAAGCRGCDLYQCATQTVFGEGSAHARLLFVGEQPGDAEDKAGKPFVGPAGKLFDKALLAAGIPREQTYVTNIVKHFKFDWRGKRRIHSKPRQVEVYACMPWLLAEIEAVKPDVVVLLGATAAQALLGKSFRITRERGHLMPSEYAPHIMATVHPSSILRAPDDATRHMEFQRFVEDLRELKPFVHKQAS